MHGSLGVDSSCASLCVFGRHPLLVAFLAFRLCFCSAFICNAFGDVDFFVVLLNFDDGLYHEVVAQSLEKPEILPQLLHADVDNELLADSVTFHVPLNGRGVHILVGFHQVDDVVFVSRATPSFLKPESCLLPRLLFLVKAILANEHSGD